MEEQWITQPPWVDVVVSRWWESWSVDECEGGIVVAWTEDDVEDEGTESKKAKREVASVGRGGPSGLLDTEQRQMEGRKEQKDDNGRAGMTRQQ